jgi:hypothetical protein
MPDALGIVWEPHCTKIRHWNCVMKRRWAPAKLDTYKHQLLLYLVHSRLRNLPPFPTISYQHYCNHIPFPTTTLLIPNIWMIKMIITRWLAGQKYHPSHNPLCSVHLCQPSTYTILFFLRSKVAILPFPTSFSTSTLLPYQYQVLGSLNI